jgi:NAD(P)-dependent dehydrogenase (short-subunit alcohol dehydrogenase family)
MGPDIRVNCIAPGFVPTRFASFFIDNETIVSNFSIFACIVCLHIYFDDWLMTMKTFDTITMFLPCMEKICMFICV